MWDQDERLYFSVWVSGLFANLFGADRLKEGTITWERDAHALTQKNPVLEKLIDMMHPFFVMCINVWNIGMEAQLPEFVCTGETSTSFWLNQTNNLHNDSELEMNLMQLLHILASLGPQALIASEGFERSNYYHAFKDKAFESKMLHFILSDPMLRHMFWQPFISQHGAEIFANLRATNVAIDKSEWFELLTLYYRRQIQSIMREELQHFIDPQTQELLPLTPAQISFYKQLDLHGLVMFVPIYAGASAGMRPLYHDEHTQGRIIDGMLTYYVDTATNSAMFSL